MAIADTSPAIIGVRYQALDKLGAGSMGAVYRALDRLTGRYVALKTVSTSTESHLALANEFRSLASLRHPNIVTVLDYGFDAANQPYFVMELLEDASTIREAAHDQPLAAQVGLLVQILLALAYLHRRGIVHRDLKPGNVLVTAGQVKLLDFGLATAKGVRVGTAGTLAYMAPEILMGLPADASTDLYAVGMIAFELLTGHHPFRHEQGPASTVVDLRTSVNQILYTQPDIESAGLEPRLTKVISKLLAKRPEERYTSANQVIDALNQALDYSLVYDTTATRDSFLQAAAFVGRESEIKQLTDALSRAVGGYGSAWLIGGESGVGKSRLVDELRILALVKGVLVLRGHAVSEGGRPFQTWRDVLRWLCLLTELSDEEAGALRTLVPDIDVLLSRDIPPVPETDPQAAQNRLVAVIEDIFERQRRPIMIILEDLHWTTSEGLGLLARMSHKAHQLPLLIIGTYRDDDRPDLPRDFPQAFNLKLGRLSHDSIVQLSRSMLGLDGQREHVVGFLQRETEGNVFFLIETVRALAEEAGKLDRIGDLTLPERVFSGGIQHIIRRRLSRVPPEAWTLLRAAAVAGRDLDLAVLESLGSGTDMQRWLTVCADAAVIEAQGEHWRFAHDKLREALLAEIDPDVKSVIHWQIARAIEAVYPDAASLAPVLVFHWAQAGNTSKEAYYSALAGSQALGSGAYPEAIRYLERAVELAGDSGGLPRQMAHLEQQLGDAYLGSGRMHESRAHFVRSLELLGRSAPEGSLEILLSILAGLLKQGFYRLLPAQFIRRPQDVSLLWAAHAYSQIVEISYHRNEGMPGINAVIQSLNLAEAVGLSPELARAYALMGIVAGGVRLTPLFEFYSRKAITAAQQIEQSPILADVLTVLGVYHNGIGEWVKAHHALEQSIELCNRFGNRRLWGSNMACLGQLAHFRGEFVESDMVYRDLHAEARNRGDDQQMAWGLCGQAMNALRMGQLDRAAGLVGALLATPLDDSNQAILTIIYGSASGVYLRQGKMAAAWDLARIADKLLAKSFPIAAATVDAYIGIAEVYLAIWERGSDQPAGDILRRLARRACKTLRRFSRAFPIGQPYAWLFEGWYAWLDGNPRYAFHAWERSREHASRLLMPYIEGRAHFEMGRHLPTDHTNRPIHLDRASEIFSRLGAGYDLERAEVERSGKG